MTWQRSLELKVGELEMRALQRAMAVASRVTAGSVRVGDLDLAHYERRRPGTPLVMVHGFGGDKETWLLMSPWLRRPPMAIVDLPGHGASTVVGRARATPAAMGRALLGYLDAQGIARAHLCGNSMGGGICLWVARNHPERVASLTLVASVAPELAESELTRALARGENLLIPDAKAGGEESDRFVKLVTEKPPRVPRAVSRFVAARRAAARPVLEELFRGWVEASDDDGLPRDLEAIDQPTLIIHGGKDRIIHPDTARRVHARLPRARLRVLDGIGHVPQLEAPAVVARLIERHLQEVSS